MWTFFFKTLALITALWALVHTLVILRVIYWLNVKLYCNANNGFYK